jgi:phage terminase large subunit
MTGRRRTRCTDVSYESAFRDAGYKVTIIPNQGARGGDEAHRGGKTVVPLHLVQRSHDTAWLDALGWYHEKKDEVRGIGLGPEHDWASHGADAFGLMCVAYEDPARQARNSKPLRYNNIGDYLIAHGRTDPRCARCSRGGGVRP